MTRRDAPRSASTACSTPRWRRRSGWSRSAAASIRAATRCCRSAAAGRCMRPRWRASSASRRIVVPPHPGVLSAAGLLAAPIEHESLRGLSRARSRRSTGRRCDGALAELDAGLRRADAQRGHRPPTQRRSCYFADVCYIGQSYHLEVPLPADAADPLATLYRDFLAAHDRVYGHSTEASGAHRQSAQRSIAAPPADPRRRLRAAQAHGAAKGTRRHPHRRERTASSRPTIYDRASARRRASRFTGPAIVEQADTTTLIEPGWHATVAADGTLIIDRLRSPR